MEYQHITAALRQRDREAVNVARNLRTKSDIREQNAVLSAMGLDDPVTRLLLTGICFARNWQELWVKPTTPRIENSQKAINWFTVVALQHAAALQKHVRLRTQFDQTVLRGQWEIADSLHAQHESAFGPTLWGMRWLFLIAEESRGSQSRMGLVEDFTRSASGQAASLFAKFFGIASDKSLPEHHFREAVQKNLPSESAIRQFLQILVFDHNTANWKAWEMLYFAEFMPLIDRYEFFLRLSALALAARHEDAVKLGRAVARLAPICSDPYLNYLTDCQSPELPLVQSDASRQLFNVWDAYVTSKYQECFTAAQSLTQTLPELLSSHELLVKSAMYLGRAEQPSGTTPVNLLWYHLRNVFSKNEHSEDSLNYLERFGSRFRIFGITAPLRALYAQYSSPFPEENWFRRAAYTSIAHGPRNFEYGHSPEENTRYLERCAAAFPDSVAVEFFHQVAKARSYGELNLRAPIPEIRRLFFYGLSASRRNMHGDSLRCLTEFMALQGQDATNPLSPFAIEEARRALIDLHRTTGNIEEMQRTVVDAFIDRPLCVHRLPIAKVWETCTACRERASKAIEFPIIAYLTLDEPHDVSLALKRFLRQLGLIRPSDLANLQLPVNLVAVLFLRVCTPEVLDSLSCLETVDKVETERLLLLRWVIEKVPTFARIAENEVLRLTQHSQLREALQKVEGARVVLNVPGLREAEQERFSNVFFRYAAQREFAIQTAEEVDKLFLAKPEADASQGLRKLEEPEKTSFKAFAASFREIRDAFVLSPHFGIEACLSGRIRHGHIIQHIRKPFVERRLAARKDGTDRPETEQFWQRRLGGAKEDKRIEHLMNVLFALTEKIDATAEELKNIWIQSKTETRNPEGMFDYAFSEEQLQELLAAVGNIATVDDFLDRVFDALLLRTRDSLKSVRFRIGAELMKRLGAAIDEATSSLAYDSFFLPLRNDLAASRQDSERTSQQLERWFHDSNASLMGDADFNLVARTAVGMIERLNPDVRGLHFIEVESCHRLRGRYFTAFVHILFFLLDNAVRHSRVATGSYSCCVTIRSKSNELLICVENRVSTPAVAKTAAKAINDRIAELKKVLDPMKVVKEGGSGFGKIMAALRYEFKQQGKDMTSYTQEAMLGVCLLCELEGIAYEGANR
jgi:hypothetical protein